MDAGSITVNTSGSACSGSLQLSADNFTSCIRMSGTPSGSEENYTFTAKPADNLSYGVNYRIRVLNTVSDTSGNTPESIYTSVKGFTTVPLRTASDQTTIACRTRPLKATPTVYTMDLSVDSASDYTGLDVDWYPVSGASSYGIKIDLLSTNLYYPEIRDLYCTLNDFQYDSSTSNLKYSGCSWFSKDFGISTVLGFTVNAYDAQGILLASATTLALPLLAFTQSEQRLRIMAERDGLTGLFNRRSLFREGIRAFDNAAQSQAQLAVLMMDLDHFKQVNDRWGHAAGDEALRLVSRTLRHELRDDDIIGRVGGEEFAVVLRITGDDDVRIITHRLLEAIATNGQEIQGLPLYISASIGGVEKADRHKTFADPVGAICIR